jgi:CHAT domain-containing protein/Tfp pilus assembly protein PilF
VILNDLAVVYEGMGNFPQADYFYNKALEIDKKTFGMNHESTARLLNNLAELYRKTGQSEKALPLYQHALVIHEKNFGPEHPDTAISLINLALCYESIGESDKALPLSERGLAINEKVLGPEHPYTARSLSNLATVYNSMGDYAKALPLFERALAINEKALGPQHPNTAMILNNLASVYDSMGDYAKVMPLYERALAINEKTLGPQHPNTATILGNLAQLYRNMGDYDKALSLHERALAIREKSLGSEHPDTAMSLNNLASVYNAMGDYAKALPLYERSLAIWEKALGPEHPNTATSLSNLAGLNYEMGSVAEACNYAARHISAKQRELQTILAQDEDTRLAWQSVNQSFWLACILEPDTIADLVLRMKGVVLDSLVEDRSIALAAQSNSEGAESLKKIAQLQARLSKLAFETGQEEEVARLKGEISQIQRDMAAKYLGRNLQRASATITQADITAKLSEGSALIDFFQFHDPKLKGDEAECLGAILMAPNNKLEFVRIDGAKAICQAIESLRNGITNGDAACVKSETEILSEKLWRPIAQKIPEGTNRLLISPDGDLNFLSFAALLSEDGKFLAESYDISYVGNARDLLRESNTQAPKRIRIFGNPIFDRTAGPAEENRLAFRNMEVDVFGQIQLPPLPGTEKECTEIQKIAANSGWDLETFTRERADEKTIRQTSKPGILHLATHGFYLNSYTPPIASTRGMSVIGVETSTTNKKGVDPMRASGIALTGAQSTLRSWAERKAPDPDNDGILTAEEVAALNLEGTWLVSLSACETGVGEARSGEGVLGLRRSFMMAGAENLLMTLWPVSDQTTSEIMADFYREALKTRNAPGSLAKVQREWLVKLRKEKGLLEAVRDAGPFVMATIGKPLPPLTREPTEEPSILDNVTQKIEGLIKSSNTDIKNN